MIETQELQKLTNDHIAFAEEYRQARAKAGKAKREFYIFLAARLPEIRKERKSIGLEMATLAAILDENVKMCWEEWQMWEDKYKGLEKLIDALKVKISLTQSIMKYFLEGEKNKNLSP